MPSFYTKQPDGKYAVYSTIVDDFIVDNATREEIITSEIERASEQIRRELTSTLDALDSGTSRTDKRGRGNAPRNFWLWESLQEYITERKNAIEEEKIEV